MKRENYISWDEYFMSIALLSAKRSKDPNRQVGACIVRDNKILSVGYNGFPFGCSDDIFPWTKDKEHPINDKRSYVVHAELNAIINSNFNLKNSILYVDLFPCNECAKAIIQAGIKEIIYLSDEDKDKDIYKIARRMFNASNVKIRRMNKTEFLDRLEVL
jgi:dCMP deaminase